MEFSWRNYIQSCQSVKGRQDSNLGLYCWKMYHPKPDANRIEIVDVWRALGCIWIDADEYAGCDGFLIAPNGVHIVEIKNPRRDWSLTPREKQCQRKVEQMGQKYNIVMYPEYAAVLAGFTWDDHLEAKQK